jgi:hypothetical protein
VTDAAAGPYPYTDPYSYRDDIEGLVEAVLPSVDDDRIDEATFVVQSSRGRRR